MYPVQFQGDIARDTIDFQGIAGSFIWFLLGMPLSIITKDTRYRLLPHNRLKDTYWILDDPLPENVPDAYIMITVSEGKIVTISYNELN